MSLKYDLKTEEGMMALIREVNNLRMVAGAAKQLMECLGGEEGYFPGAGYTKTMTLRDALRQAGHGPEYGQRT